MVGYATTIAMTIVSSSDKTACSRWEENHRARHRGEHGGLRVAGWIGELHCLGCLGLRGTSRRPRRFTRQVERDARREALRQRGAFRVSGPVSKGPARSGWRFAAVSDAARAPACRSQPRKRLDMAILARDRGGKGWPARLSATRRTTRAGTPAAAVEGWVRPDAATLARLRRYQEGADAHVAESNCTTRAGRPSAAT
jgi:hypothetical protein